MSGPDYIDDKGRQLFVDAGLGRRTFMTFWTGNGVGRHRIRSKFLPIRGTQSEAQADLDAYALKHGWKSVGS